MGLLYSKYTSPMEFMRLYIEQGRFGEFVEEIWSAERKRRTEEADKENEQKLWELYLHSMHSESFNDWKRNVLKEPVNGGKNRDEDLKDADILNIIDVTLSKVG